MTSLPEAARRLVRFDRMFEPDAAWRAYYDEKFGKYRELYEALRMFNG
jgi:sugar (pentulose or hexulose) kinase